jgi:hypothetical protein
MHSLLSLIWASPHITLLDSTGKDSIYNTEKRKGKRGGQFQRQQKKAWSSKLVRVLCDDFVQAQHYSLRAIKITYVFLYSKLIPQAKLIPQVVIPQA